MKILVLLFAALLVAGFCEKSSGEKSKPLSDADVERLVKEAVVLDSAGEWDDAAKKLSLEPSSKQTPGRAFKIAIMPDVVTKKIRHAGQRVEFKF